MRTLILDQYSSQPLVTRWIGNSLTGLGWAFWIFLWLPLLTAIALLLELNPGQQSAYGTSQSIPTFLATLQTHFIIVLGMAGFFLAWAILQSLGKCKRFVSLQKAQNPFLISAINVDIDINQLQNWRSARMTIVKHGINGVISNVEILSIPVINDFSPEPLPKAA